MLEVIIGMLFAFMLLSLLGTTVNELISAWRGWRGFYLEEALKRLLEFKDNPEIFKKFKNNSFYKQLNQHKALLRVSTAPAYLASSNFTSILMNVLKKKGEVVEKIEDLFSDLPEDSKLREILEQLKEEGYDNLEAYKARLQSWFDGMMEQSSGWYKRHLQFVTLFVGLGIAAVFNADSFQIYSYLTTNSAARQKINLLAEKFISENKTLPSTAAPGDSLTMQEIKAGIKDYINSDEFRKTSNILGLGWNKSDLNINFLDWMQRVLGWFVTALAISLGAPFWFDVLKKLITIQSPGAVSSAGSGTTQVVVNTGAEKDSKK